MRNRPIYNSDIPTLEAAIAADKFHAPGEWTIEHFRGFSEIWEDDKGVIVFCHFDVEGLGLRISTMWVNGDDTHRNGRAIIALVKETAKRSRSIFSDLRFTTKHERLARFCCRALGFISVGNDEYVLRLKKEGNECADPAKQQ
jgi:hypothetical protein